jgi:hypothetical protein
MHPGGASRVTVCMDSKEIVSSWSTFSSQMRDWTNIWLGRSYGESENDGIPPRHQKLSHSRGPPASNCHDGAKRTMKRYQFGLRAQENKEGGLWFEMFGWKSHIPCLPCWGWNVLRSPKFSRPGQVSHTIPSFSIQKHLSSVFNAQISFHKVLKRNPEWFNSRLKIDLPGR